jgi:hypothetical protein
MREFKIYTCGKMSGISFEQQMGWRCAIESLIKKKYDGSDKVKFIHPPLYYNYEHTMHKSDKEILDWEMMQLHNCDIVIVNLDGIDSTTGSHMELGAVQGINRFGDKYIYVIGIGNDENLHPWIKGTCNRIENNYSDAVKYIIEYLLV